MKAIAGWLIEWSYMVDIWFYMVYMYINICGSIWLYVYIYMVLYGLYLSVVLYSLHIWLYMVPVRFYMVYFWFYMFVCFNGYMVYI